MTTRPFGPDDREPALAALAACGAFDTVEIEVASGMIDDGLLGRYSLLAVEQDGAFAGYSCFGPAPLTRSAWYLYWICLRPEAQGRGLGRSLENASEEVIVGAGGTRLVVETSGRPDYRPVRRFYRRAGFVEAGRLTDFYRDGDDCVLFQKVLREAKHD